MFPLCIVTVNVEACLFKAAEFRVKLFSGADVTMWYQVCAAIFTRWWCVTHRSMKLPCQLRSRGRGEMIHLTGGWDQRPRANSMWWAADIKRGLHQSSQAAGPFPWILIGSWALGGLYTLHTRRDGSHYPWWQGCHLHYRWLLTIDWYMGKHR